MFCSPLFVKLRAHTSRNRHRLRALEMRYMEESQNLTVFALEVEALREEVGCES
jgi:hypothetical protein